MVLKKLLRDPFKQVLFELGAGYYARKLATGPEADIRRDFVAFLNLPPATGSAIALQLLDVGCGPGHVARGLAQSGYHVTGVDRSHSLLRIAKKLAAHERTLTLRLSPTERLPFPDASFDYTYATGVIYWVEHMVATLREMVRVTRPSGTVAFLDPHASMSVSNAHAYSIQNRMSRRDRHKMVTWATSAQLNRRFEESDLRKLLTDAGLVSLTLEQRLGGMVWFGKGRVPEQA
jgi:ubiquinone/menaquinone biosynthesis C-methylase UbiE